ncbi:hypothetical protein BD413DRAFT_180066 [Trametes elegans]|nr:hypothetical protein BD413DRAFT_180066 [Trametes elegans]
MAEPLDMLQLDHCQQHATLYFPTGDVILLAPLPTGTRGSGDGPKSQLFRVHRNVLGHHSEAFTNLFGDASAQAGLAYDGQPVIELTDKAADVASLLQCLYDPYAYLTRRWHPDTPIELSGAVRLADKYLLDTLRSSLVKRVVEDWPKTLDEWDVANGELKAIVNLAYRPNRPRSQTVNLPGRVPEPASAIMFAQEFGCHEILPAAYYRLATIEIDNEWERKRATDSTTLYARWTLLDSESLLRYISGRRQLDSFHNRLKRQLRRGLGLCGGCMPFFFICPPEPGEEAPNVNIKEEYPCLHFITTLLDLAWDDAPASDPLQALHDLIDHRRFDEMLKKTCPEGLCHDCTEQFYGEIDKARGRLWKLLPLYFQVDRPSD